MQLVVDRCFKLGYYGNSFATEGAWPPIGEVTLNKCHLDYKVAEKLGESFYRVLNNVMGHPRYVIHWLAFASEYDKAESIARSLGFKKYRGREFGGGFVIESFNLESTAEAVIRSREEKDYE